LGRIKRGRRHGEQGGGGEKRGNTAHRHKWAAYPFEKNADLLVAHRDGSSTRLRPECIIHRFVIRAPEKTTTSRTAKDQKKI